MDGCLGCEMEMSNFACFKTALLWFSSLLTHVFLGYYSATRSSSQARRCIPGERTRTYTEHEAR